MTVLIVRILFLLLPGAIASVVYWKLRGRNTQKDWEDLFEIVFFSLISYLAYGLSAYCLGLLDFVWQRLGLQAKTFSYFQPFFDDSKPLDFSEVLFTCLLAIPVALVASYLQTYNVINRFGTYIGATTRFGDEDVWEFINRSPDFKSHWVTVRDYKSKLNYSCWIEAFSDSGKERELLLREVAVYDDASCKLLYEVDMLYLSRKSDEVTLEANKTSVKEDVDGIVATNHESEKAGGD